MEFRSDAFMDDPVRPAGEISAGAECLARVRVADKDREANLVVGEPTHEIPRGPGPAQIVSVDQPNWIQHGSEGSQPQVSGAVYDEAVSLQGAQRTSESQHRRKRGVCGGNSLRREPSMG